MADMQGIEPCPDGRQPTMLPEHFIPRWTLRDSNSRTIDCKSIVIPLHQKPRASSKNRTSIQLFHRQLCYHYTNETMNDQIILIGLLESYQIVFQVNTWDLSCGVLVYSVRIHQLYSNLTRSQNHVITI